MLPLNPERIARLRSFGLSEYAARAYLALLDLGVTEARDVATLSKVPASKIYHVLDQLHEKGLVEIVPEFPRKYAAVLFGDHLRRLHQVHVEAAQRIEEEREELERLFARAEVAPSGDRGGATLLRGRRNLAQRLRELLDAATAEVVLLPSQGFALDARAWEEPLRRARSRGVDVRVLPPAGEAPHGLLLVVDGRRGLLAHVVPDDGHPLEGNDLAIDVDQEGLAAFLLALTSAQGRPGSPVTASLGARTGPTGLMR